MLERLQASASAEGFRFALTGAAAAEKLQHFYRAPELSLFIDTWNAPIRERLRLLPDREGPLVFLRAFGELVFWREVEGYMLTHPWLIYAELMHSDDSRAHEAAEELRQEHLRA